MGKFGKLGSGKRKGWSSGGAVTYRSRDLYALDFGVSIWKASRASGSTGEPSLGWGEGRVWCLVSGLASGQEAAGLMVQ
jgi:hypothetical protein